MRRKYSKKVFAMLLVLFPMMIAIKIFQYKVLSLKYFTDAYYIQRLVNGNINIESKGTAYYNTAIIFKFLKNIFHLSTLKEWSYLLGIIYTPVCFSLLLNKLKKLDLVNYLFLLASFGLINIFVFNMSKDIIQFTIFIIIYLVLISKYKNITKILLISITLILETKYFRSYYILILFGFIIVCFLYKFLPKTKNKKAYILLSLMIFLGGIFLSSFIVPSLYNQLINVRDDTVNMLIDVNTTIDNVFDNSNYVFFVINYLINGVRILFPLELLFKGPKYILFVIYQLYLSISIIKTLKKNSAGNELNMAIIIGYFLGSIIFEPDFGSLVRHESTLFLIYLLAFSKKEDVYND